MPNIGLGFIGLASSQSWMKRCIVLNLDTDTFASLDWMHRRSQAYIGLILTCFLSGRCETVLLDGISSRRGREALLRAGDDYEEVVERRGGAGLLLEVAGVQDD